MDSNRIRNRNITLLIIGRTISLFGASIYLISLPLYILKLTNNLAQSGLFFSLATIPSIIITPFLGVVIEKINRKFLMIICDLSVSFIYFCLYLLTITGKSHMLVLLIASMIINVISKAFEISSKVLFTELNSTDSIEKFNGIKSTCDNASSLIAPAIGTFIFGAYGFHAVLAITSITYFISAIQERFIEYKSNNNLSSNQGINKNFIKQLADGISFISCKPNIRALFILVMSLNFFIANGDEIINPGILIQKFKISSKLYGFASMASIIGTLLAGFLIFKNKYNLKKHIKPLFILNSIFMIMVGLLSLLLINISQMGYFYIFLILQLIIGFITTCINIPLISYFQVQVPLEYQARFFSMLSFSSSLLIPLGISYTGFLASYTGADIAYIINNVFIIIIVFIVFLINQKLGEFFSDK
ncbi:MAG: MFS transporter [Ruminococcaceae bacterium]|nr:MFS transporter [Oscillospiraceae bacterium]